MSKKQSKIHKARRATKAESREDCCGDRYTCNVAYVCSCGEKGCESCIKDHFFEIGLKGLRNLADI